MFPAKIAIIGWFSPPLWHHLADGFWTLGGWGWQPNRMGMNMFSMQTKKNMDTLELENVLGFSIIQMIVQLKSHSIPVYTSMIIWSKSTVWTIESLITLPLTPVLPMNLSIQITFGSVWAPLKSICFDGVPMFDGMPAKNTCVFFWIPLESSSFAYFYSISHDGSMYGIYANNVGYIDGIHGTPYNKYIAAPWIRHGYYPMKIIVFSAKVPIRLVAKGSRVAALPPAENLPQTIPRVLCT